MDAPSFGRRQFLGRVALGSAVGTTIATSPLAVAGRRCFPEAEDFQPHIGSTFRIRSSEDHVIRLLDVLKLPRGDRPRDLPRQQPFVLVFETDPHDKIGDDVVSIEHRALGCMRLLLCATSADRIEAVFN